MEVEVEEKRVSLRRIQVLEYSGWAIMESRAPRKPEGVPVKGRVKIGVHWWEVPEMRERKGGGLGRGEVAGVGGGWAMVVVFEVWLMVSCNARAPPKIKGLISLTI